MAAPAEAQEIWPVPVPGILSGCSNSCEPGAVAHDKCRIAAEGSLSGRPASLKPCLPLMAPSAAAPAPLSAGGGIVGIGSSSNTISLPTAPVAAIKLEQQQQQQQTNGALGSVAGYYTCNNNAVSFSAAPASDGSDGIMLAQPGAYSEYFEAS